MQNYAIFIAMQESKQEVIKFTFAPHALSQVASFASHQQLQCR